MSREKSKTIVLEFEGIKPREEVAVHLLNIGYSVYFEEEESDYYPHDKRYWLMAELKKED